MTGPATPPYRLVRVPVDEVVPGDRVGGGRHQGVVVTEVKKVPWDTEMFWLRFGSHGWASFGYVNGKPVTVLVERPIEPDANAPTPESAS